MRKRHVEVSQPPLAPGPGERAVGGGTMDPNTMGKRELDVAPSSPSVHPHPWGGP